MPVVIVGADLELALELPTAFDPYVFTREAYLQQRLNLIYDGDPPLDELENLDLLEEEQLLEEEKTEGNTQ